MIQGKYKYSGTILSFKSKIPYIEFVVLVAYDYQSHSVTTSLSENLSRNLSIPYIKVP